MDRTKTEGATGTEVDPPVRGPLPVMRSVVGGLLMGLANLVPGVSGGTMILVVGLYDEFITAVADVTRLHFTRRGLAFLAIVGFTALVAVGALAETLSRAVTHHQRAMFSLFIGMPLGGVPLIMRMLKRATPVALAGLVIGLGGMVAVALTREEPPNTEAVRAAMEAGTFLLAPSYARDVVAGVLGISAMILPGISGAYMLLILGRYETILAAIAQGKDYALSLGREGDPAEFLGIIIPVCIGAAVSLVTLSNLLKWMLHRHEQFTLGMLLGILLGSVIGIWPFHGGCMVRDYLLGAGLAVAGFLATFLLARLSR